jgi:hypothetical protein
VHMKYLRVLAIGMALSATLLVSGCMSVRDPKINNQTGTTERSAEARPNILLVFQVGLERKNFATRTPEKAEALYHLAGQAFVKRIEALGGQADYKVFSDSNDFEIQNPGHTHVLTEKIKQISVDSNGNAWDRVWDATLWVIDKSPEKRAPKKVMTQLYEADGVRCFSASQYANRAECQVKYIDHLVAQVAPVFAAK